MSRATWIAAPRIAVPPVAVLSLMLMLVGQGWLFRHYALTQIVPAYPRGYDQALFLDAAYDTHQALRERGVGPALAALRQVTAPQGELLQVEAALALFLDGPPRMAALDVNFAHLVLFELSLFAVAGWLGRPVLGLALCGLLLGTRSIYFDVGGMADFRLDFAGFALLGTLGCAAIRSGMFRSRGWSLVVGLLLGMLLLTRTVYGVLVIPSLVLLAGLLVADSRRWEPAWQRVGNLALAAIVAVTIALPSVMVRWQALATYYGVGHGVAEGTLRAQEYAVSGVLAHLVYYAQSAFVLHAGPVFLGLAAILAIVLWRREDAGGQAGTDRAGALALIWIAIVAATAYAVLTIDQAKSPIVGRVFVAFALCALVAWASTSSRAREGRWVLVALIAICIAGQTFYATRMLRPSTLGVGSADLQAYLAMIDTLIERSRGQGLTAPVISFDRISERTNIGVVKALAFERHGLVLSPVPGLGGISIGLQTVSDAELEARLARSDFALLGADRADDVDVEPYPLNLQFREHGPQLFALASRTMTPVGEATFYGRRMTLFVKPVR